MTTRETFEMGLSLSSGRTVLPAENTMLNLIYTSMKQVAMDTLCLRLVGTAEEIAGFRVLRKIDYDSYVRYPVKPSDVDEELVMDEFALEAMAYWCMKLLEPQRQNEHYRGYKDQIDMGNGRLVETMLSEEEEESTPRNCMFP